MTTVNRSQPAVRSFPARTAGAIAALAVFAGVLTGCGGPSERPPTASSSAQTELRAPVPARANDAGSPTSITAGDATAPIDAVATDFAGALLPPQDVDRLGWWVDSGIPGGGRGTVVITGHVDEASQGEGFAARFGQLRPGAEIRIDTAGARTVTYRVQRIQLADKTTAFPAAERNRLDGPETLALVTCGGPFVGGPLGYRDNVIAWAERV